MVKYGAALTNVSRLASVAVRSFVGTVLVLTASGMVLALCAFLLLKDNPVYGLIAATVALLEAAATGVVLGGKRALILALAHGFSSFRLGRTTVGFLFDHLLGVSATDKFGKRGGMIARHVERLPLAQAENRLNAAVNDILSAQPAGGGVTGWLRRTLQSRLLDAVHKYTLARFREQSAREGGVDLALVQRELEELVDIRLVAKLRSSLNWWTVLVVIGLPTVVFAQTFILVALLK